MQGTQTAPQTAAHTLADSPARAQTAPAVRWFLPELIFVSGIGIFMIAFADVLSRASISWAAAPLWIGLLLIFVPISIRLTSAQASRRERIGLLVLLWGVLYVVKVMHSPTQFTFGDELQHWLTADNLLLSQHLFSQNSILPISPYYPGLEMVTSAVVNLTGMSIYSAGILIIAAARLVLVLTLYVMYETISKTPRVAGLETLLYIANPMFLFFDAQFAYESLALPFATFALLLLVVREDSQGKRAFAIEWLVLLAILCLTVTHHVTTIMFMVCLGLWFLASVLKRNPTGRGIWRALAVLALTLTISGLWLFLVASFTVNYLGPTLTSAVSQLLQLISGEVAGRELYRSFGGVLPPLWERLVGYGSTGLVVIGLPFGIYTIWKHYRENVFAVLFALGALAYPLSNLLRFTATGIGIAVRLQEFLFIAVGFVLAVGIEVWLTRYRKSWLVLALSAVMTVIFVGGIVIGWSPSERLPGPYQVSSHGRSVERESLQAGNWMLNTMGTDNRVGTDYFNRLILGSTGRQYIVTFSLDGVSLWSVFYAKWLGDLEVGRLRRGEVQYVVADERLTRDLPINGVYFEYGEPDARNHVAPLDPQSYTKFDLTNNIGRIFDSGNIVIYDVRRLVGG